MRARFLKVLYEEKKTYTVYKHHTLLCFRLDCSHWWRSFKTCQIRRSHWAVGAGIFKELIWTISVRLMVFNKKKNTAISKRALKLNCLFKNLLQGL